MKGALVLLLAASAFIGAVTFGVVPAVPHDAAAGWSYPFACCAGYDCRLVNASPNEITVEDRGASYVIRATGEVLSELDPRVKPSPDGEYHWCSVAGRNDSRTICLFVPPKGM